MLMNKEIPPTIINILDDYDPSTPEAAADALCTPFFWTNPFCG